MATDIDPSAGRDNPKTLVPLKIEEVLVAAAMAAMALITVANVVTRYLTDISLAFTEEYSVVLMVLVALLGTAVATASGRHIRIGYFTDFLSPNGQRVAEMGAMVLTVICFAILVRYGWTLAYDEYRFEVLSNGLGNPNWWYTGWLPVLSVVVVLRAMGRLIRLARGKDG
ncbi:TRAP transporter small permease [Falsiroseomonas sp. HW251]|uniref:TRAP transporter small permease n=1 Tax=Falsiroseomonas sp. HW251 TaxID=3390998 RepID=UPI003D31EFD7